MHLPGGLLHCSATSVGPPRVRYADEAAELARRFGGWHEPIPSLIAATTSAEVLHHDVEELAAPLPACHQGRVAFVGDSAHAKTPNPGPACLALEDAAVLGRVPALHDAGPDGTALLGALRRYTAARMPRAQRLTIRSRRVGAAGTWSSPIPVAVRNLGLRLGGWLPPTITGRPGHGDRLATATAVTSRRTRRSRGRRTVSGQMPTPDAVVAHGVGGGYGVDSA